MLLLCLWESVGSKIIYIWSVVSSSALAFSNEKNENENEKSLSIVWHHLEKVPTPLMYGVDVHELYEIWML